MSSVQVRLLSNLSLFSQKPQGEILCCATKNYSWGRGSFDGLKQPSYHPTFSCPRSYSWHRPVLCPTTSFFTKALQNRGNIALKYKSYCPRMYLFQSDAVKKACSVEERWEIEERTRSGNWRAAVQINSLHLSKVIQKDIISPKSKPSKRQFIF